jgi:hypothetical protein
MFFKHTKKRKHLTIKLTYQEEKTLDQKTPLGWQRAKEG